MKRTSSLERKMLTYFGLIAAASLLITVEFLFAIHSAAPDPHEIVSERFFSEAVGRSLIEGLHSLRNKALLMFVVQVAVTLTVLIMFMRRITGPLEHMVETSRLISEGDLSRTIQTRSADEIGLLGETINGLTSNIQELVGFGLSTEASIRPHLDEIREAAGDNPDVADRLDQIDAQLEGFSDIMHSFTLFPDPLSRRASEKAS